MSTSPTPIFLLYNIQSAYTVSYPVMLSYKIFTIMKTYLESKNLKIYDIVDFISQQDQKNKIIDEKLNFQLSDEEITEIFLNAINNMMAYINTNNIQNGIIIGFHPAGFDHMYYASNYQILKNHNFKLIMWQDDLHCFNRVQNIPDSDVAIDSRIDNTDYILTPSIQYYKNIKSPYLEKTIFYFYCLNDSWFNELPINNFKSRTNKILLSGCTGKVYPLRYFFYEFCNNKKNESHRLYKYFDYLEHPSYDRKKNQSKSGINYLKILNSYKGAFFGFYQYPLNYPLAKIIEILASGTLGFFEYSPVLEEQLGLIKYVHYVPILVDKHNKPILDINYYKKYLNEPIGEQIMLAGCKYVREKFTMKNKCDEFIGIVNRIK